MISGVYFLSMVLTVYSAAILGSYILVCLSSVFQGFAIAWFLFSIVPGGSSGFLNLVKYAVKLCPCFSHDSFLPV